MSVSDQEQRERMVKAYDMNYVKKGCQREKMRNRTEGLGGLGGGAVLVSDKEQEEVKAMTYEELEKEKYMKSCDLKCET